MNFVKLVNLCCFAILNNTGRDNHTLVEEEIENSITD